ncbi:DUF4173 domain-containing protein [Bosea psychrotolerans]|uniref:Uncharacterized protein DUF4173 n=1 Tax=Bosea psychrotolerans TaxID=1871628 RepID=A0A2S4MCR5_9HYPH|nr:DUF4173 domain-containing protein [Bosea psychrotolerans]POR52543.1 uncharacterized protein DUF4173 [Bosea psychrotolerans]
MPSSVPTANSIPIPAEVIERPPTARPRRWLQARLGLAAGLVLLADLLFYGHALGISLAYFLATLAAASLWANPVRASGRSRALALLLLGAGLLAIVEEANLLSSVLAILSTAVFAVMISQQRQARWQEQMREARRMLLAGAFRLLGDIGRVSRLSGLRRRVPGGFGWVTSWIIPLAFLSVFATLFASANPLLESWLRRIDLRLLLDLLSPWRMLFWLLILCLVWPMLHVRAARKRNAQKLAAQELAAQELAAPAAKAITFDPYGLFGDAAILRSLVLFNALFAVQTGLDIAYLWGGVALPDGMSYATYAHRGAYPLVVTALLAAVFVMIAMRPAGPAARKAAIRPLVLAWVGQNIMLMVSSLLRLDLYVAAYSLTWLRLVAFIWMLLVAIGLVLIVIQISGRKSTNWLVSANAAALALTLYGFCFVNTPAVIANYNFRHSQELRGTGPRLDVSYLTSLGPQAIPALDRYAPRIAAVERALPGSSWSRDVSTLPITRDYKANKHRAEQADWRAWGFRAWRLSRYLANTPTAPFRGKSSPATPGQ